MAKKLEWHTEKRKIKDLIRYEKNPRILSATQLEELKRSLRKYNLAELPAINVDGTLVAGNQRVLALSLIGRGEEEIEVRVPNRPLTDKEFRDYLLTSNRSGADWDWAKLAAEFDLGELLTAGFNSQDLGNIFDDNLSVEDDGFDEEKEIEKAKKTKIRPGDYFAVGPHRVLCGNSEDPAVVKRLVGNEKIDLTNIDFPYNVGWLSYDKGVSGAKHYGGHVNDKKSDANYRTFVKNILTNAVAVSKDSAHYFAWTNETYLGMMQDVFKECGIDFRRLCAWLKGNFNPVPSCAFNKCAEWCSYGTRGKSPYLSDRAKNLTEIMNREVDSGNRTISDVNDLFAIWLAKRIPTQDLEHPTMKPPSLYEKSLRRCSKPGDAVLDLCAGSGSFGVACSSLKRRAFLCDQEPVFCQVIINRLKKISNEPIKKLN